MMRVCSKPIHSSSHCGIRRTRHRPERAAGRWVHRPVAKAGRVCSLAARHRAGHRVASVSGDSLPPAGIGRAQTTASRGPTGSSDSGLRLPPAESPGARTARRAGNAATRAVVQQPAVAAALRRRRPCWRGLAPIAGAARASTGLVDGQHRRCRSAWRQAAGQRAVALRCWLPRWHDEGAAVATAAQQAPLQRVRAQIRMRASTGLRRGTRRHQHPPASARSIRCAVGADRSVPHDLARAPTARRPRIGSAPHVLLKPAAASAPPGTAADGADFGADPPCADGQCTVHRRSAPPPAPGLRRRRAACASRPRRPHPGPTTTDDPVGLAGATSSNARAPVQARTGRRACSGAPGRCCGQGSCTIGS